LEGVPGTTENKKTEGKKLLGRELGEGKTRTTKQDHEGELEKLSLN